MTPTQEYKQLCQSMLSSLEAQACEFGLIKKAYENTGAAIEMTKVANRAINAFDYASKKFNTIQKKDVSNETG